MPIQNKWPWRTPDRPYDRNDHYLSWLCTGCALAVPLEIDICCALGNKILIVNDKKGNCQVRIEAFMSSSVIGVGKLIGFLVRMSR